MRFIACCVLAAALGLSACKRGPDISKDPAVVGQTITLTGKVQKVHQPNVVELDTPRGDVLVVTPQATAAPKPGDRVSVTGDVRRLTVAEVERDYAPAQEPAIEIRLQEENIVAAHEIKPA